MASADPSLVVVYKLLVVVAYPVGELGLWGFRSCGAQVKLPHDRWDLPRPVIEPLFPALADSQPLDSQGSPPPAALKDKQVTCVASSLSFPGGPGVSPPRCLGFCSPPPKNWYVTYSSCNFTFSNCHLSAPRPFIWKSQV